MNNKDVLLCYKYLRRIVVGKLEEDELIGLIKTLEKEVQRIRKEQVHESIQKRNKT